MKNITLAALTLFISSNAFAVSKSCEAKVATVITHMSAENDKASDYTIAELTAYELTVYSAKKDYVAVVSDDGKCSIIKACEAKSEGVCYDQD